MTMPKYYVLIGPPGAGKGTQAQRISKALELPHISSGDLFREHLKNETDLGKKAKSYMDRGELVPDDLTIAMVRERLAQPDCEKGALLDGFPRTPAQAEALAATLKTFHGQVNAVPYIKVSETALVKRLSGRWTCRAEGHVYHEEFNPPKKAGFCDVDGSELYQREDDQPATVINRIQVYFKQTMPLIEYYAKAGLLLEVDGGQSIDQVTAELLKGLTRRG
jgi:adenylate kinase